MRTTPWTVGLSLGFVALVWGLVLLQLTFVEERDETIERLTREWESQNVHARRVFAQLLERDTAEKKRRIRRALMDPLVEAQDLFVMRGRERILPRSIRFRPGTDTPGEALAQALSEGRLPDPTPGTPWAERLALYAKLRRAVAREQRDDIEVTFREILSHRARFVVRSEHGIPLTIAILEFFVAKSDPDLALMEALLRTGLADGRGGKLESLMRSLLRRRDRFSRPDFEKLTARVAALAEQTGVVYADFLERARAKERRTPLVRLKKREPVLDRRLEWYFLPGDNEVVGFAVNASSMMERVAREMLALELITPQDHFRWQAGEPAEARAALDSAEAELIPAPSVPIEVDPDRIMSRVPAVHVRFWLKTGLAVLCGGFALGMLVLGVSYQNRKRRFLELKSDFVATVSHELRTPLASMRLLAETLERKLGDVDRAKDYPERIVREIDGMNFLVENILSFNRLDKDRWDAHKESVRVADVLSHVISELEHHTPRTIRFELEGESTTLQADPELMKLMFMNLGRNACSYSERDPIEIHVTLEHEAHQLRVRFRDNGVGIPEAEWSRIFGDFYRPDTEVSKKRRGSGLGLALCKRVMELHGGSIAVVDSGPEGSTFELCFPT